MIEIGFLTILALVNLIAVKLFGEVEFWFAMVKIVAILAMIATGVFMVLTGFKTPHGVASLANIADNFSLFPNGGVNFVMAFQMVFFAYLMIEFIGVTTSETKTHARSCQKRLRKFLYESSFSMVELFWPLCLLFHGVNLLLLIHLLLQYLNWQVSSGQRP